MKVNIALLTVTDTRTLKTDKSGNILVKKINKALFIFFTRIFPDLSVFKVLVSVTVNSAIFTFIIIE